jgi:hypothetical protein
MGLTAMATVTPANSELASEEPLAPEAQPVSGARIARSRSWRRLTSGVCPGGGRGTELPAGLAELLARMEGLRRGARGRQGRGQLARRPCPFEWPLAAPRLKALLYDDRDPAPNSNLATAERIPSEQARARLVLGRTRHLPARC